jgi:3',5'-cyclic-AMP phosphodiesterase
MAPNRALRLVQLSDPHIGATWGSADPARALAAAVELAREHAPDAVLVSGDLVEEGTAEEYDLVAELLEPLGVPVHVLPGNHDDRAALRRRFALAGEGAEPVQGVVELGPLRLVLLDTTRPGEPEGELDAGRLAWLDARLAESNTPTVLALHHPPLATGTPAFDGIVLPDGDRRALAEVVARHEHVRRLVAGHVHRPMVGELAGRPVITAPSTYVQLALDLASDGLLPTDEPTGFALHLLDGETLVSHVVAMSSHDTRRLRTDNHV